jgi:hypothetical protein
VFHQPCRDKALAEEFKKKPVIITQEHLDMLNRSHLMMTQITVGRPEISVETNQDITEEMARPWFHEMDLEQKFYFMKQVEAIAAQLSIVLGKDKERIRTAIQSKDIKKFQNVQEYREQQLNNKTKSAMRSLSEIEKQNEKTDPMLKAKRKAIEGFMKVGLSLEQATKMVEDSQGKAN